MGGFNKFGIVFSDYLIIKGSVVGFPHRLIVLRICMYKNLKQTEIINTTINRIDTSSKHGNGRFQTSEEKANI